MLKDLNFNHRRPGQVLWLVPICLALLVAPSGYAFGQDPDDKDRTDKEQPPAAAGDLPGPPPIPQVQLLPTLKTTPVSKSAASFNVNMVDASLLPRDREGIWVLDFAFKPMRMRTVEVPGKGRKQVYYLYYKVVNRTGKPRDFVPQLTILTDTRKRFEESIIPNAVKVIKAREDDSIPLLGAVDIAGTIPPSTKDGVDDAVYGVAVWEAIDPKADRFSVYIRGLSDGFTETKPKGAAPDVKPTVKYKTLRIDFIRRGDHLNTHEKEIELAEPGYEWIYW